MKICHMTSAHDSDDIRILKKQCVSLAKVDSNDVYLVAKGDSYEYKGVKIIGVEVSSSGRLGRILKVSKAVYNTAVSVDADVYEFHDPELLLYAKKLKKLGKKVIFDSHENYSEQIMQKGYIPKYIRKIVKAIYSLIENNACKYIDAVLYPSESSPYIGRVKECVPIFNTPMLDELEIKKDFSEKEDSVCCVGTLSEDRGIRVLVNACYKAGVKLVLGGNFSPPSFEDELRAEDSFSIVDYRGYCDRQKVNDIYDECLIGTDTILNVGQYPYLDNLSTKVYEYMIMKMPYITSDFKYNKSIVDKYNCGVCVNPSDENAISEAISFLVNNKKTAREMGENGRRLVEKNLNWKFDEERLINLYEKLYNA